MKQVKQKAPVFMVKEQVIETQIRHLLNMKSIFHWKAKTVGTFDQAKGVFRKHAGYMKGVSDLIGIYKEKLLAIEVKSAKGKLSPEQVIFMDEINKRGGLAFVARSVEDVQAALREFDNKTEREKA